MPAPRSRIRTAASRSAVSRPPSETEAGREVTAAQLEVAAGLFDLLSVPARLGIVILLAHGEFDVSTLAERTGQSIPATSQQLAKLRAAAVVSARREGRRQLYRVDDPHMVAVVERMLEHIRPSGTVSHDGPRPRLPRRPRFTAVG